MSGAMDVDAAFLALLRADDALAEAVFDGQLRNADGSRMTADQSPRRYVVVHSNRGVAKPDRFAGYARRRRKTYIVHSVGLTKRHAEMVSERVLDLVLNRRLAVDGWQCDPITHESSQPVEVDESIKPVRWFGVDTFDLYALPRP